MIQNIKHINLKITVYLVVAKVSIRNTQRNIPISGEEFERLITQIYYEKCKDMAIIEPNLILFE